MITLFHQRGDSMDQACLATCLSKCLIVPNIALQDYILWKKVDNLHAKATISYGGMSASGIFTFNEEGGNDFIYNRGQRSYFNRRKGRKDEMDSYM